MKQLRSTYSKPDRRRFLYNLLLRGAGAVAAFRVANDGSLTPLGTVFGVLPVANGASGLAAY